MKTSKIRQAARMQDCMIRIPGVCNFNPETTVLCHKNGGGFGMKSPDYLSAFGCSDCHAVVDFRRKVDIPRETILIYFYDGIFRTQIKLQEMGLLKT